MSTDTASNEIRALSELAFAELRDAIGGIGAFHRAIAERAFNATGAGARPARLAHDTISEGVYATLRGAAQAIGRGAGTALATQAEADAPPLSSSPRGATVLGALNGLIGDKLESDRSPLQAPMAVRVHGVAVPAEPAALAAAFPEATPRLCVFVHGLMGTELTWRWYARAQGGETYGSRLARDLSYSPVYVRFNTGRHISENGRSLSELLEDVVETWPVPVEQIALVGHSMGGLVSRSACRCAEQTGADWVSRVRHVVSLGTPHLGAPLAQAVHVASAALSAVPETRPLAGFLRRRSAGIRDLRHGSLVDEDWRGRDPHALRAAAVAEVPLLEGANHCFVAATVTRTARHPVGRLVGDLLVLESSASGRSRKRQIPFEDQHGMHLGSAHHLALLNHPDVYPRLRNWLATAPRVARLPAGS